MGEFEVEEGNRIRFKNMGTTLMMCPDVDLDESLFLEVFNLADNYTIKNDTNYHILIQRKYLLSKRWQSKC